MAKIVFKNILRSFLYGLLAVVVTGIILLLLLLLLLIIRLVLSIPAGIFGADELVENVSMFIKQVIFVLTLVAGIFVALFFGAIFEKKNAISDNNGYKKKTYPPIKVIKIAPCVPLIFSVLLLPVFVLCIVAFFVPSLEAWIAGLFPNLSVGLFHEILLLGSGMLGTFMGTLFFYYRSIVSSYKYYSCCKKCRLAFCVKADISSSEENVGVQYKTKTEREQVGTIKYGSAESNVYVNVDRQYRRNVIRRHSSHYCKCKICGEERHGSSTSYGHGSWE